jgi:hypothetical protein
MLFIEVFIAIPGFNLASFMSPDGEEFQSSGDEDDEDDLLVNREALKRSKLARIGSRLSSSGGRSKLTYPKIQPGKCSRVADGTATTSSSDPASTSCGEDEKLPIVPGRGHSRR